MTDTWIAATMVAITTGCVGFFVVARGASFAAHALPLAAFPGAALASLLGADPVYGLVASAGLGAIGISQIGGGGRRDTATALSLVFLLGLGALFLSLTGGYANAVYTLLFGEVLGIDRAALAPLALTCAVAITCLLVSFRPLLLSAAAPAVAAARGLSARHLELWFLAILALAAASALPIVGALLAFSLAVAPAAAARYFVSSPVPAMALSTAISVGIVWAAIALSYVSGWPVGFFVGALGATAYAAGRLFAAATAGTAFTANRR